MTSNLEEWNKFDPGFDHGQVELKAPNIDGVFSAAKISDAADLVRVANVEGQVGDESFDWAALDVQGKTADVRSANLRGQVRG